MKDFIKNKLRESFEIREEEVGTTDKDENSGDKYKKVQDLLADDIFNHSAVIRDLWGEDNATKRSLFAKKLNQKENSEGGKYTFSDEELTKIINTLMTTSRDIRRSIGKSGQA